jgi:rubrerythrin
MKYMDEYQYGIYPYVPNMEPGESRPVFHYMEYMPEPQKTFGNLDAQQQSQSKKISDTPEKHLLPQNIRDILSAPEKISSEAFDWGSQDNYRSRDLMEINTKNPDHFQETPGYIQSDARPLNNTMPADPYPYNYPQNLNLALELMQEALAEEDEDKLFYDKLFAAAPTPEDRDIISGIRNDEMKHFELFRKLYYEHTGQILPHSVSNRAGTQMTYCEGLKKALLGEVAAARKYRKILFAMQDRRHANILTEILTDELSHAVLLGLLFDLNACCLAGMK